MPRLALTAAVGLVALGPAAPEAPVEPAKLAPDTRRTAAALRDRIAAGSKAYDWVREILDRAGPRLAGSPGDRLAVEAGLSILKSQGFANVRAEPVSVPVWQRGVETGEVTSPVSRRLALTALGGSVGTPAEGVEAEIVRVGTLEEIDLLDASACRGRILFIDRPMARTSDGSGYGDAVRGRSDGASKAARLGAAGLLIRSIGPDTNRLPHTGSLTYAKDAPRIPAAALSVPDAELLTRLVRRGGPVRVRFTLGCETKPDAPSANVIGEVVGREKPDEIVLLGAHLDSWDLGAGAIDDGAGCGIVIEAARQIAALSPHPRRTVRVVLFANEENGLAGGRAYAKDHAAELERHVAALEVDTGEGPPLGLSWNAGPAAEAMLKTIAGLIGPLGAGQLKPTKSGGADISRMLPSGTPSLGLLQDSSTYFDYHHTANDTLDKIDPAILDRSTAATAVVGYVLAETPETLARIPAENRALEPD
ncbi:MAG TPA: M20/M25/M40 family metallo-hydrolase [Thermoanaerobaculia bacterium]